MEVELHNRTKGYPTPSKLRYRMERIWLRAWLRKLILKIALFAILAITLMMCLLPFKDELKLKDIKHSLESFIFTRPELSIKGLSIKNTNPDLTNQIKAMLQLSFPINPLKIDINYLQELINSLESVNFSKIRITENGVLEVVINERIPVLLHRKDTELMLLDMNGRRIGEAFSRVERPDLPLVVGEGANKRVQEALEIYKISSPILNRIRGLILVGERRWDIVLNLNQRIKLPDEDAKMVLLGFLGSRQALNILSHNFSVIDLRLGGRVIVRKRLSTPREERV